MALDLNSVLADRYRIGYVLEDQPGCLIYRAYRAGDQVQPDSAEPPLLIAACEQPDPATQQHTLQIAAALQAVQLPVLLPLLDTFSEGQTVYMVVADLGGTALHTTAREQLPGLGGELDAGMQRIEALLHLFGQLHSQPTPLLVGELHSSDIWLGSDQQPRLAPFALIRPLATTDTPYRAPELDQPDPNPTRASDMYALGGVLYYLLTGWQPLTAAQREAGMQVNPPSSLNPLLPPLYDRVLERALSMSPHTRYNSPSEVLRALQIVGLLGQAGQSEAPASPAAQGPLPAFVPLTDTAPAPDTIRMAATPAPDAPSSASPAHLGSPPPAAYTPPVAPVPARRDAAAPAANNTCLVLTSVVLFVLLLLLCSLFAFLFFGPGLQLLRF
ncbi:MAG: hypothetical protein HC911_11545 [Chloroflexaceae bacterium]|nr:hypothetical protein [Chloroflexaceae bacterium]